MIGRRQLLTGGFAMIGGGALLAAQTRGRVTTGTISGRIVLNGAPPGNAVVRMGLDPRCAELNRAAPAVQASALVGADHGIANVFVRLVGSFSATPVPREPIVIDQRSCIYAPRVVGMRVGQTLRVRNDDALAHNVHSSSAAGNSFNVGQGKAGEFFDFTPQVEEVMVKLGCDIHRWMIAYVGVLSHPYFTVSVAGGRYAIPQVPPGTYQVATWHERFGETTKTVTVAPGVVASVDFGYAT